MGCTHCRDPSDTNDIHAIDAVLVTCLIHLSDLNTEQCLLSESSDCFSIRRCQRSCRVKPISRMVGFTDSKYLFVFVCALHCINHMCVIIPVHHMCLSVMHNNTCASQLRSPAANQEPLPAPGRKCSALVKVRI